MQATIERLVDLTDPAANVILNMTPDEAALRVRSGDPAQVRGIDGQFAIVQKEGRTVRMARSIARPLRYFIAKRQEGPSLVVAERIDQVRDFLRAEGLLAQFHPSYTRMVPAHYLVEISLVGCPDPNPTYTRFFTPQRNRLPADVEAIGRAYIGALAHGCQEWLERIGPQAPIGVLFSGGIDSGAVFLVLYHLLVSRGESPARLKAFTLAVDDGGNETGDRSALFGPVAGKPDRSPSERSPLRTGADADQAQAFLAQLGLGLFQEVVEVPAAAVDLAEAVRVLEDYKPLDVQSAAMALALCRGIRNRYPEWRHLVDGDGGDENLKDYPIEENPELTIRSVLNNLMLYQEGWGVHSIKHSLTYSGGQSRGHVRSYAPARATGFDGFSPFALPNVIEVAEGIPFVELTGWDHHRLYALKGQVVASGIKWLTGMTMPVYEKRRFQHGAASPAAFAERFPKDPAVYRQAFAAIFETANHPAA